MKGFRTKKITLPGGKVLEIVYFQEAADEQSAEAPLVKESAVEVASALEELDAPTEEPTAEALGTADLHVCPECAGSLVYPVEWEEHTGDSWRLSRRCPSCEWVGTGEFAQEAVDRFDDVLSEGTEALLSSLRAMVRANMEQDVERLISAIQTDRILPIDF
jgi:hypothetical protein